MQAIPIGWITESQAPSSRFECVPILYVRKKVSSVSRQVIDMSGQMQSRR